MPLPPNMVNGSQIRAARAWLNLSREDLSRDSHVAVRTIATIESGQSVTPRTLADIERALRARGIDFIFESGRAIGIRGPSERSGG
ncbi:helix-turn-helix transcriptional regulator [Bradyrhizobium sp. CSS354]|uniref:helix-turn-helix domain-containing protein n=1 Tax=Bradyrhizobium sp. CSS354 TaxID=2699172 RepID=UPI0023C2418A|nr:helix-turn-helix domain-containing protein [Bradyrhizobium sp. CSS354]